MKKILLLIMALSLVFAFGTVTAFAEETNEETTSATEQVTQYVAEMNGTKYETLEAAVADAPVNTPCTVTFLKDAAVDGVIEGKGIVVNSGQIITFDFNECTYRINELVGSAGTETLAMQLLKDSTVILKNGTLTSEKAKMLVQNYSDLTIDNFTLDGRNLALDKGAYTLSNNCGSVVVKGKSNIYAKEGCLAFDLWYGFMGVYNSGVSVRFDDSFNGEVIGNIEYGASNTYDNWIERTSLVIGGNGVFDGEILPASNNFYMADANIKIYGSAFTCDVSAYREDNVDICTEEVLINEKAKQVSKRCYHIGKIDVDIEDGCGIFGVSVKVYCKGCSAVLFEKGIGSKHNYSEELKKVEPTCVSLGYKILKCNCGASKTEIIPVDTENHKKVSQQAVAPDCENTGLTAGEYCEYCKEVFVKQEIVDALGHKWNDVSYTWSEDGKLCIAERGCSRNSEHKETATATVTSKVKAATCDNKGKITYTATFTEEWAENCTKVVDTAALGHDWDNGTVTKKATCVAEGVKTFTCKNDKSHTYTKKVAVDSNAHAWTQTSAKCSLCGDKDALLSIVSAKYGVEEYTAGNSWVENGTLLLEAKFKNHNATITFKVGQPSAINMNEAGRYIVTYPYEDRTVSVKLTIYPANTTSLKASAQTTTTVTLKWAAATGANGYRIFYKAPGATSWKTINDTTALSYKVRGLKAGTKYTFAVRPFYDTGSEKLFSKKYPQVKTATCTATPEITKVTASASTKGKAYVYHSDVAGETGYTVYYSTSSTTGFKKYANFKADTTRADITGLTSGKTYYFKVRTYIKTDSGYVYSPWSAVSSVKVK